MTNQRSDIQVRFCPSGRPTIDEWRTFARVPQRGESITYEDHQYVVVEIDWQEDGKPFAIAHAIERPRAQEALRS